MVRFSCRPVYRGSRGIVSAGHYLAAAAGYRMYLQGGNAIDAAAAAAFAMAVVEPHANGIGGESPVLLYSAREGRVVAVSGQGRAPRELTIERFRSQGFDRIPGEGPLAATVPAMVDAWITAVENFGSLPIGTILDPAIELAAKGWAAQQKLVDVIAANRERFEREWPSTARIYGGIERAGQTVRNPDLAKVLQGIALHGRKFFYDGPVAEAIERQGGPMVREDLAAHRTSLEEPWSVEFGDTQVFKCGPWSQGPVFLQQLRLLERFDLREMGHNSADYLHTWIECARRAFADREQFYGDGADVRALLTREYAARRVAEEQATWKGGESATRTGDTTHVDAVDRFGNLVSGTPSGGWIQSSPVIEGLGFPLGTRAQMFSLDPSHPNALAPGKRPRTTLSPTLAFRGGAPWIAFGTPGGDQQDQWSLQFFLNVVVFGMDWQEALEAPTVHTSDFPSSFFPREAQPGVVWAESRVPAEVLRELGRRGHRVKLSGPWDHGRVTVAGFDGDFLFGAASPRGETAYVIGD